MTNFPQISILDKAQVALASASPRRRELLARLLPPDQFRVISADVDESRLTDELPEIYVKRLAITKARAGEKLWLSANPTPGLKLVIAADTSVILGGKIYGKPTNHEHAAQMLTELSGQIHQVLTGYAVRVYDSFRQELLHEANAVCTTEVEICPLSTAEIGWYIATGEPMDKAGSYAIQDYGGTLVSSVRGDYYNVVGLPLVPLINMLRDIKV